jgi:L-asparaginase / beta-aspartyl-peptidase
VLLVHGGAWDIPADQLEAHTRGVTRAVEAGYALLRQGASALDGAAFSPGMAGCSSMRS